MPKATLEFNLPEDKEDFMYATEGVNYMLVLYNLDQYLRGRTKYADESQPDLVTQTYQEIRDKLNILAGGLEY